MKQQILDHGYLELVESWGSDERIIEAARMSTNKGFLRWDAGVCPTCDGTKQIWDGVLNSEEYRSCPDCGGKGTIPGDEKLLRFLWQNKHHTPFEMAGMTVEVMAPIMVFREWHRHRTQCLAGDTKITCVSPSGSTYTRTVRQIYELRRGVVDRVQPGNPLPPGFTRNGYSKIGTPVLRHRRLKHQTEERTRIRVLPNCQNRTLRVCVEETGEFATANMADVWESGTKEVFLLETVRGFSIKASAEHPFLTEFGWVKLKDLRVGDRIARMGKVAVRERPIPPALRKGIGVWTSMMRSRLIKEEDRCYICGKQFPFDGLILDHVVPVSVCLVTALDERNLRPACELCSRLKTNTEQPSRVGITRRGIRWEKLRTNPVLTSEEMTYDIEVDGLHHNYVANEFVVHNSYNEMSARYTPLPDVNYLPTVERCLVVSGTNRQAGTIKGADEITHESALEWLEELAVVYAHAERVYQSGLKRGIPKEVARLPVPVGRYSRMRASANLRNWLAFLTLRMDSHAQFEIRQFANAVGDLIAEAFPRTWSLFAEGQNRA